MSFVYILRNSKTDRYYIGLTNDLNRRLDQHVKGRTRTTKILQTFELAYSEEYKTIEEAIIREKKLKSYKSKKYIKWLIKSRATSSTGRASPS